MSVAHSNAAVVEIEEVIARRYPREVLLDNGSRLTLTRMVPSDWEFLERFLRDVPDEDRLFFRREATAAQRVERWCQQLDYRHVLPVLAWDRDRIVADGILQRDAGLWTSHVGKIRILVHSDYRRLGIGGLVLSELATVAKSLELHKLAYECAADQTALISFLVKADFFKAARLLEFIRDRDGRLHEMVVMARKLR